MLKCYNVGDSELSKTQAWFQFPTVSPRDLHGSLKPSKLHFPHLQGEDKNCTKLFIVSWFLICRCWWQFKYSPTRHSRVNYGSAVGPSPVLLTNRATPLRAGYENSPGILLCEEARQSTFFYWYIKKSCLDKKKCLDWHVCVHTHTKGIGKISTWSLWRGSRTWESKRTLDLASCYPFFPQWLWHHVKRREEKQPCDGKKP